ncbi:MAG: hypothetical protein IT310_08650 [Anaerolineales bacterium]|nr:hypothetical protein [Anaerolineales bacterium]
MQNQFSISDQFWPRALALFLLSVIFAGCQPAQPASQTLSAETNVPVAESASPTTEAVLPSPTAVLTPPALPENFQTDLLNPLDRPHAYLQDTCQYLKNKWDPSKAKPGTVVMIILMKGIYKGPVEESGGIDSGDLDHLMMELKRQGFEAINTKQLLGFMERNLYIPPRSVVLIQDGNRKYENFSKHLGGYWEGWGWPVVNGWVSQPDTLESLWAENIALEKDGFVDHQPQGVMFGTVLSDDSSKTVIMRELQGSYDAFVQKFEKNPIAFIWPGGGFGQRPVEAARQLKYQLGFTSNSRGPVMYNWVPLADEPDPLRPAFTPEGKIGDPLMTLPRYWPSEALMAIDKVRTIGNQATTYAEANKKIEIQYYNIVCADTYGQISTP